MNTEILPLFSVGFERKGFSNKNFRVRTLFFETDYFVHGN